MADDDTKLMSILAYILFFVPILVGAHKKSETVRFHTNQGTVLFIAAVIYSVVYSILARILMNIPFLGWLLIVVLGLCSLVFLVLMIIGIINAASGKQNPLPVIGKFTVIK